MKGWQILIVIIVLVGFTALIVFIMSASFSMGQIHGYKQGQIDALNGKWEYEQVVQPDTLYIKKPE